jgi:hypothetical protein
MSASQFLKENIEDGDYNQYWYSEKTIGRMVEALIENGGSIAFLSTPSIYFALPEDLRSKAYVFDVSFRSNIELWLDSLLDNMIQTLYLLTFVL